jgi:hypothetical protein
VFSESSKNNTRPSAASLLSSKRLVEHAKANHTALEFRAGVSRPMLIMWVDAAYSVKDCAGRLGYECQLLDEADFKKDLSQLPLHNMFAWRSAKIKRKIASSTAAELLALKEGIKVMPLYSGLVRELWGVTPKEVYVTDSQPLLAWLASGGCKQDPEWQGNLNYIIERITERGAQVLRVGTAEQRADRHTKFVKPG